MLKIYANGKEFYEDNKEKLDGNQMRYAMIIADALLIEGFSKKSYAIKAYDGETELFLVNDGIHSAIIDGNEILTEYLVNALIDLNLEMNTLLAKKSISDLASKVFKKRLNAEISINLSMHRMEKNKKSYEKEEGEVPSESNINEITELYLLFAKEAINKNIDFTVAKDFIEKSLSSIYILKDGEKIAAVAKKSREMADSCSVSFVYTRKEYRGKGYAKKLVNAISNSIIEQNKTCYLYVDDINPISNHVYEKIGFKHTYQELETTIINKYRSFIVAGGCFWCMAKPYNEFNGVKKVVSGYSGGNEINPTYEMVKAQKTGHRECVRVIYDPNVLSFSELLNVYFESIDPFDDGGQFIDRGMSYSLALYTSDDDEIKIFNDLKQDIEKRFNRRVCVSLVESSVFYPAEEYHQDYAIKNKEAFEEEEHLSHRDEFEYLKL